MYPITYSATSTALDRNGITAAVSPAGAATLNIDGALANVATDADGILTSDTYTSGTLDLVTNLGAAGRSFSYGTYITIASDGDDSGAVFTIWGLGRDGKTLQTERITGPNTTTVYSSNVYTSIERIDLDTNSVGNITVGVLGVVVLGCPQHVTTYGATAATTCTFHGLDRNGAEISETVAVATTTTTVSTKNFARVEKVTAAAAATGIEMGVDGTFDGPWLNLNTYSYNFNVGIIIDAGTGTFNVQSTDDDIYASTFDESTAMAKDINLDTGDLSAVTADAVGVTTTLARAVRLQSTSTAASGQVKMYILQNP